MSGVLAFRARRRAGTRGAACITAPRSMQRRTQAKNQFDTILNTVVVPLTSLATARSGVRGMGLSSLMTLLVSKLFTGGLLLVTWWVVLGLILGLTDRCDDSAVRASENNGLDVDEGSRYHC